MNIKALIIGATEKVLVNHWPLLVMIFWLTCLGISCAGTTLQQAADKIAATRANRDAVCALVWAYAGEDPHNPALKRGVQACEANKTAQEIVDALATPCSER